MKVLLLSLLIVLLLSCGSGVKFTDSASESTDTNSQDSDNKEDASSTAPLSTSTNGEVYGPSYK